MIFDKVKAIIVDQLGVEENEVKLESSFVDDLGADSLDVVELVMAIENEFEIEISDEDYDKVSTVGDGRKFDLWSGKIPHTRERLSL